MTNLTYRLQMLRFTGENGVSDKELAELDLAVAKAVGFDARLCPAMHGHAPWVEARTKRRGMRGAAVSPTCVYQPTREPRQWAPLLTKYRLTLIPSVRDRRSWIAGPKGIKASKHDRAGPTPAIAICRAVVALHAARSAVAEPPNRATEATMTTAMTPHPKPPSSGEPVPDVRAILAKYLDNPNIIEACLADLREAERVFEALRAAHQAPQAAEQGEPGFVLVPQTALDWLFGDGPNADGKWFGEEEDHVDTGRRYWWRSVFRRLIGPPPPLPQAEEK